jgi:hypothetical protein
LDWGVGEAAPAFERADKSMIVLLRRSRNFELQRVPGLGALMKPAEHSDPLRPPGLPGNARPGIPAFPPPLM